MRTVLPAISLDHLSALTDDVGVIQHAKRGLPNRDTGYCTDDVSRAFIVAVSAAPIARLRETALRLGRTYLAFLHHAQMPDGRFHNFMGYDRTWLDDVGTEDANGRAIWSIGYGMRHAPAEDWRHICAEMLELALPRILEFAHVRARAYAAIGLAHAYEALARKHAGIEAVLRAIGDDLRRRRTEFSETGWDWFEPQLTYDNARLSEAALRIGSVLEDRELVQIGLETLDFYESVVVEGGVFVPIGNDGWYTRAGERARFGQQPLEAAAMVDACLEAYELTQRLQYLRLAELAHGWFYGLNSAGAVLARGGGCCDGLEEGGVNANMGAESTLAYLASVLAVAQPSRNVLRIAR
ncbi:MAG TPA: hypothetical protein VKG44_05120 [Candidatus Baltobacteraceae bacterium]|nr:hypothetical protein [Candidatus Baltobacteraceae bacterium]